MEWGRSNFHNYTWRSEKDPWLSFLAEFLLQRTRATQVEPVYATIKKRFPTAQSLLEAGELATTSITRALGLHRRGPMLLAIADVVARRGGTPPESLAELRALGGVGIYTSAAWLSLHRNKRASIVDANVSRWLSRMTLRAYQRDPRHVRWVQELAEQLTPRRAFRAYNYAVLDFTMEICRPRNPQCGGCPLAQHCPSARRPTQLRPISSLTAS